MRKSLVLVALLVMAAGSLYADAHGPPNIVLNVAAVDSADWTDPGLRLSLHADKPQWGIRFVLQSGIDPDPTRLSGCGSPVILSGGHGYPHCRPELTRETPMLAEVEGSYRFGSTRRVGIYGMLRSEEAPGLDLRNEQTVQYGLGVSILLARQH